MRVSMKLIGCDFGATMPLRSIDMRLLHFRETRLEDLHILGLQALELRASMFQDATGGVVQGRWDLTRPSIAKCSVLCPIKPKKEMAFFHLEVGGAYFAI